MPADKIRQQIPLDLRDGTPVLLRPVRPQDKSRFVEGLRLMSLESRYLRFFAPVGSFSEKQLAYLTEVDQRQHVAWGALDPLDPNFPGFGVARYVREEDAPEVAEVAVAVIDSMHRRGLGTVLLGLLYLLAGWGGVRVFRGTILPANSFLIDWARALQAQIRFVDGAYQVDVPVHRRLEALPDSEEGTRFKTELAYLQSLLFE
jgi:GNAT superfamily N-acetyltransferase